MLLGLAGNLLKSLGGKKKKISGEEMAQNVMNESKDKSQNPTTVFHEKKSIVKGADIKPLTDIRDDMKASSKKSKDPLNLALDGIDNSLFGIIDTLTKTNLSRKKGRILFLKQEQQKKKTLRERMLEGASGFIKGAVGTVKGLTGGAWDKMMQFIIWTLAGAIVNAIVKNWDEIQKEIQKLVDDLKNLWDSPIMKIFREFAMWTMTKGLELTKMINPKDIDKMKKDADKVDKELNLLQQQYEDVDKMIKSTTSGNNKEENNIEDDNNIEEDVTIKYTAPKTLYEYGTPFGIPMGRPTTKEGYMQSIRDSMLVNYNKYIAILEDPSSTAKQKKSALENYKLYKNSIENVTGWNIVDSINPKSIIGPNDVLYNSSTQTFSKNLALSPNILRKFGQVPIVKDKSSNLNFSSAMDIESHYVGLEAYSDEDFNTQSSIILFSQENETGMNYFDSDINFDYKMPETTLNIKELFLLEKLNK